MTRLTRSRRPVPEQPSAPVASPASAVPPAYRVDFEASPRPTRAARLAFGATAVVFCVWVCVLLWLVADTESLPTPDASETLAPPSPAAETQPS